ncbi:unnamed protein product [Caenorhabditis bovis]|uniref:C2H2-type domain-containing protein n=1 Tax=Caenorhabditis bovis TaxID=2654633 RepID=A0A8S1EP65_9PELO|nr:unnamed protein product [Caenorhabditis bovis]
MPYRPEAELKRPDLKGEFLCGHCGKTFCHAASLNRHRLNFHGDDQQCLLCMQQIPPNDTVRRHMSVHHGIARVFTCGCCNWTFPDKKELHSHNNSMLKTGKPGEAKAIAISSRPPGSLSQHELKGEERTPSQKMKKKQSKVVEKSNPVVDILSMISSSSNSATMVPGTQIPASWLSTLFLTNPSFLPLLQQQQQNSQTDEEHSLEDKTKFEQISPSSSSLNERASTSMTSASVNSVTSSVFQNNNFNSREDDETLSEYGIKNEIDDDDHILMAKNFARDLLIVKTEPSESSSSGPESGIGSSGDDACTPSPLSVHSKEGSPDSIDDHEAQKSNSPLDVANILSKSRKRKSVDAIASLLFKKKCMMK